jgi:aldehyde:ferredoxin oxidoreductase
LRSHLGGASAEAGITEAYVKELFMKIGDLEPGEFLLFSPTALLDVVQGTTKRLHFGHKVVRTRLRISEDAGKSRMASEHEGSTSSLIPSMQHLSVGPLLRSESVAD